MSDSKERVRKALADIRDGKMVILVDDEDRENEGDLVMAAEKVTAADINFMATHARGLICLTLTGEKIEKLKLPMMVEKNNASLGTAFTVSIEAKYGVTTGISAADRAATVIAATKPGAKPEDLVSPGHIFPLKARDGGVLVRTGQTEGSVDLARLAGLDPSGVICEIMKDDGEMARMPELEVFAEKHNLQVISVADLISFRLQSEKIVRCKERGPIRPAFLGEGSSFEARLYQTDVEDTRYIAIIRGDVKAAADAGKTVMVRVQTMCPLGDVFSLRPDTHSSLRAIDDAGVGVFLYIYNQERVSIERSFERQVLGKTSSSVPDGGLSEVLRDFGLGAQVLADIGCKKICLLSDNDRKIVGIEGYGIEIVERIRVPLGKDAKILSIHGKPSA